MSDALRSVSWAEFERAEPELAALGAERLDAFGLLLLATLRPNGWPRISPIEPVFGGGEILLGMMWRSQKARDLQRDPRCTLHSTVTNKDGNEGDFKLYGRAREVFDLDARASYCDALFAKIGWKPVEPEFHVFAIDVASIGYTRFENGVMEKRTWRPR